MEAEDGNDAGSGKWKAANAEPGGIETHGRGRLALDQITVRLSRTTRRKLSFCRDGKFPFLGNAAANGGIYASSVLKSVGSG
jgi:hypothetical protein